MADLQKRLEKAEKYLQKGKQQDALEVYLEILQDDPSQDGVRQTAADLAITLGHNSEAASLLETLFEKQAAIGDQAKAVASYKKLLRLGTATVEQTFRYAQFIEKTDKKAALEAFLSTAIAFEKGMRKPEAASAWAHVVALDGSAANYQSQAKAAEAAGDPKTAANAYLRLSELEKDKAAQHTERAYKLDAGNPAIALAHARSLLDDGKNEDAVRVIKPAAIAAEASVELKRCHAQALLACKNLDQAEPIVWQLFEQEPDHTTEIAGLLGLLLNHDDSERAFALARRLEAAMAKHGKRREFISLLKEVSDPHQPSIDFLEYLVELYNSANREHDYCETLTKLFELHYAAGNFLRAADALDRVCEVDPYEEGNHKRLAMLQGKIEGNRHAAIANRLGTVGASDETQSPAEAEDKEPTVLEDFMLQAEIFLQYSMRSKAVERLERINKLFAHEEERNEKLRALFNNAGFVPKYAGAGAVSPAPSPASAFGQAPSYGSNAGNSNAMAQPSVLNDESAVDNFARVTEITRNIYRQSAVKGVLFTAVNDVGRHFNASRCVAGLISPGNQPSAALEYCAPGIKQSEVQHIVKLLGAAQEATMHAGIFAAQDAAGSSELGAIRTSIETLGIQSLLAAPLLDSANDEHVGILLLEQCDQSRQWRQADSVVLKTIADQMVLAVNNAKLRSLMKNLAVTDEKSGLLKRSSYLDVLQSETKRAFSQNSTMSVLLLKFGKTSMLVKELGEPGVESMMQQIGQTVCAQIRQNDVAVRYDLASIALILPDTTDKNSFFVVDKMRKALTSYRVAGTEYPVQITVGIAEAVMQQHFEAIDVVTEVINRAENALESAQSEGGNTAKSLAPLLAVASVA